MYPVLNYITVIIIIFIASILFYCYLRREWFTNLKIELIEKYIHKYHSDRFIHIDRLKEHSRKVIADVERRINEYRDRIEKDKLDALAMNFKIQEMAYIAELERMEGVVKEVLDYKNKLQGLHYSNKLQRTELTLFINKAKDTAEKVVDNMKDPYGRLETLANDLDKANQKYIKEEPKDLNILQIENKI